MFILLYANCVVMYCVSFYVVVGNKLYLILYYLITRLRFARVDGVVSLIMLYFVWLWLPNLYHLHISDQFRNSFLFQSFCSNHDLCILRARYFHTVLQTRSYLTRFNKIATQGAPQMAVDKEANSLSRVYSYYSKFNLRLFYV